MADILSMVCPPGTACSLTSGFGLPEILLWVLSFAVIYTFTTRIMSKKPAALVSIALGFFVLMAAPAALTVGLIIVLAIFGAVGPKAHIPDIKDGKIVGTKEVDWMKAHGTAVAVVLIALAGLIIWTYGGAQLIGITSLPAIGAVPAILVIVGAAVLWMLS
jgi:hypothetical protein